MNIEDAEKIIDDHVQLIIITAEGLGEARERASKFLVANALLAAFLKNLEVQKAKISTLVDAHYAQALREAPGKGVTEKKVNAVTDSSYAKMREALDQLDAQRDWLRNHIKIFENAHLMYRQYSRE